MRAQVSHEGMVLVGAVIQVTDRCNLECRHCYRGSSRRASSELPYSEFVHTLEVMARIGIAQLVLSGGEPLLHRDFVRMVEESGRRGLKAKINTNGTLVGERLLGRLGPEALFEVRVSLDGGQEEHDHIRGAGQYEKTVTALAELAKRGYLVTTATVRGVGTAASVDEALEAALGLGVAHMHVYELVRAGRARDLALPYHGRGPQTPAQCKHRFPSSATDSGTRHGRLPRLERVSVSPCSWTRIGFLHILPDGSSCLVEAGSLHGAAGQMEKVEETIVRHLSKGGAIYDCRGCEHLGRMTCSLMHDHCVEDWQAGLPRPQPARNPRSYS